MSTNNGICVTPRLNVTVTGKADQSGMRAQFIKDNGLDHITELLQKAGYTEGDWIFRLTTKFKGSGKTPPMQVRRCDPSGVHLWIRPRDGSSAVKGTLVVMKPLVVHDVYMRLRDANSADVALFHGPTDGTVTHIDAKMDEDEIILLLDAINEETSNPVVSMDDFILRVSEKLGERTEVAHWLEVSEELVSRQLLIDNRTHYSLTVAGKQMLDSNMHCGTVPVEVKPQPVVATGSVFDLLLQSRERLLQLVATTEEVTKIREKQNALLAEITRKRSELTLLEESLKKEKDREAELTNGINVNALTALIGGAV